MGSSALDRLKNLTSKISSYEIARKENLKTMRSLFEELQIGNKLDQFEKIFDFQALNLSGISLAPEDLGAIREKKYVQVIAIEYHKDAKVKNRNISLGYYGRSEKLSPELKNDIVKFVLCWRFEKTFRTLEHYYTMLGNCN